MPDHSSLADENLLRNQLLRTSVELVEKGLNRGASGNCSVRLGSGKYLITPSGTSAEKMSSGSMVKMALTGEVVADGKPSSEWRFHRDIFRHRPDVAAIVHTHSTAATALACLRRDLPPFHYMIASAGGDSIRCAPYALFGSQALSNAALVALQDRKACLLANHGVIALGSSLDSALALAVEVENLCEQYLRALAVGEPAILSSDEMAAVIEQFKDYGPQALAREADQ